MASEEALEKYVKLLNKITKKNFDAEILSAIRSKLLAVVTKTDDASLLYDVTTTPAADVATLLAIIAKNNNLSILKAIAKNPAADDQILSTVRTKLVDIVAETYEEYVLDKVALIPAADAKILSAIVAKTNDRMVLLAALNNPNATQDVIAAANRKLQGML